jgi:ankyrin repeat protein
MGSICNVVESYQIHYVRSSSSDHTVLFKKVSTLIKDYPRLCQATYQFIGHDENEIYPLHFLCSVNAPVSTIRLCYRANEGAMRCNNSDIGTPLHYACFYDTSIDLIQYLIMKEPKSLARVNIDGRTPFLLTCLNSNVNTNLDIVSVVGMLSINTSRSDRFGNKPLHLVCSNVKPTIELIELIASVTKDVNAFAMNRSGQTPLHLAVAYPKADLTTVKTLIKMQIDTAAQFTTDKKGQTPLHVAVGCYGSLHDKKSHAYDKNIIYYLARKYPQTLHIQDLVGNTPMDIAQQLNLGSRIIKALTP